MVLPTVVPSTPVVHPNPVQAAAAVVTTATLPDNPKPEATPIVSANATPLQPNNQEPFGRQQVARSGEENFGFTPSGYHKSSMESLQGGKDVQRYSKILFKILFVDFILYYLLQSF